METLWESEGQMPNPKDSTEMELVEGAGVVSELGPSSGGIQRKMGSYFFQEENGS